MTLLKINRYMFFVMSDTLSTKYGEVSVDRSKSVDIYRYSPTKKCNMVDSSGLSISSCLLGAGFKEKDIKSAKIMRVIT